MNARIINTKEIGWIDLALSDHRVLFNDLNNIGIHENTINEFIKTLEADEEHIKSMIDWNYRYHLNEEKEADKGHNRIRHFRNKTDGYTDEIVESTINEYHKSWFDSLKELIGLREQRIENEEIIEVKMPLFKFNSPSIRGSEVVVKSTDTIKTNNNYTLSIIGTGLGITRSFDLSISDTFSSCDGAFKLVFVPIKVRNRLIGIYDNRANKQLNKIIRTELLDYNKDECFTIGIDEIGRDEFLKNIEPVTTKIKRKYSGDKTCAKHTFSEKFNSIDAFNYEIGINAFNINSKCKANISYSKEIILEFKLPTGYDYEISQIMNGLGILCEQTKYSN
jgi:hypothetical protein